MREIGPVRTNLVGEGADNYMSVARTELGRLKFMMQYQKQMTGTYTRRLPGGVTIRVQSVFGQDFIEIVMPVNARSRAAPAREEDEKKKRKFRSVILYWKNGPVIWDRGDKIPVPPPPSSSGFTRYDLWPISMSRDGEVVAGSATDANRNNHPWYWKRGMSAATLIPQPIASWMTKTSYDSEITHVNADGTVMLGYTRSNDDNWPEETYWVWRNGTVSFIHRTKVVEDPLKKLDEGVVLNYDEVHQFYTKNELMQLSDDGVVHGWAWPAPIEHYYTAAEMKERLDLFFAGKYTDMGWKAEEEHRITEYNKVSGESIPLPTDGSGFKFFQIGTEFFAYKTSPQMFATEHYSDAVFVDEQGNQHPTYKIDYAWHRYEYSWAEFSTFPKFYLFPQSGDEYIHCVAMAGQKNTGLTWATLTHGAWLTTTAYKGNTWTASDGTTYGDARPYKVGPDLTPVGIANGSRDSDQSANLNGKFFVDHQRSSWHANGMVYRHDHFLPEHQRYDNLTSSNGAATVTVKWDGYNALGFDYRTDGATQAALVPQNAGETIHSFNLEGISADGKTVLVSVGFDRTDNTQGWYAYIWTLGEGYKKLRPHSPRFTEIGRVFLSKDGTCVYGEVYYYPPNSWDAVMALVLWEDFNEPAVDVSIEMSKAANYNDNPYITDMTTKPKKKG